jgi:branched-chain amino acid transport system ATP-binding protein
VARALVAGPRLLMLDEPSLGLAPQVIREMFDHLRTIHRQTGVTILLVEQAAAVALQLADEAYVLSNGHMLRHGPAEEIRTSEEIAKVYFGA